MIPKFRAWDKKRKKLGLLEADMISGEFQSGKIYDDEDVDWMEIEEFILMQSTGLKDKNGKEIFEKDIVDYKGRKAIIKWHGSYSSFIYVFIDELKNRKADWKPVYLSYYKFEVVGNRFETPELLEADNDRD